MHKKTKQYSFALASLAVQCHKIIKKKKWAKVLGGKKKRSKRKRKKRNQEKKTKCPNRQSNDEPFLKEAEGNLPKDPQWAMYYRIRKINDGQKEHFCCTTYLPRGTSDVDKITEYYQKKGMKFSKKLLYAELKPLVMHGYLENYKNNETVDCGLSLWDADKSRHLLYSVQDGTGKNGRRKKTQSEKKPKEKTRRLKKQRKLPLKKVERDLLKDFYPQWAIYCRIRKMNDGKREHFCCSMYRPNGKEAVVDKMKEYYKKRKVNITKKLFDNEFRVPVQEYWKQYNRGETADYGLLLCDKKTEKGHDLLYRVLEVKSEFLSQPLQGEQSQSLQSEQIE